MGENGYLLKKAGGKIAEAAPTPPGGRAWEPDLLLSPEILRRYLSTSIIWGINTLFLLDAGLAGSFWLAVALYLVAMATMGVWGPVRQAFMHQVIPSEQQASVISLDSLAASGGSVFGQIGLGRLAQTQSIASGYVVGGITTFLVLPVLFLLRRLDDPADLIIGTAGKQGACAAQGLPSVSAVDTSTHVVTASES